jgi:hypothetical protein
MSSAGGMPVYFGFGADKSVIIRMVDQVISTPLNDLIQLFFCRKDSCCHNMISMDPYGFVHLNGYASCCENCLILVNGTYSLIFNDNALPAEIIKPAQIFVASVIKDLCLGKQFTFSDRGESALKGFDQPVRIYEVQWQTV